MATSEIKTAEESKAAEFKSEMNSLMSKYFDAPVAGVVEEGTHGPAKIKYTIHLTRTWDGETCQANYWAKLNFGLLVFDSMGQTFFDTNKVICSTTFRPRSGPDSYRSGECSMVWRPSPPISSDLDVFKKDLCRRMTKYYDSLC